jgi:hypothetical protein
MENNQKIFGLTRKQALIVFIIILLSIVWLGTSLYDTYLTFSGIKFQKTTYKFDAEIIADFQAHKEEFNQIPQKLTQIQKNLQILETDIAKKSDLIKTNKNLSVDEQKRLSDEQQVLIRNSGIEREKRDKIVEFFTKQGFPHYFKEKNPNMLPFGNPTPNILSFGKMDVYQEKFSEDTYRITNHIYRTTKGLTYFDENVQPDKQYVVDDLDNFHSSNNIKLTVQKFMEKFGEGGTIYRHLEDNWYIYLSVSIEKDYVDKTGG